MPKWDFRQLAVGEGGKADLALLSPERRERIPRYVDALSAVLASQVADPRFSNYYVLESLGTPEHPPVPGGNIEYGFCQALHAEAAAVAALRARYGRFDWNSHVVNGRRTAHMIRANDDMVLGIIAGAPGNIATPCGNCRDIMLDDLGREFEIVSGAKEGGTAVVASMGDYLFEHPRQYAIPAWETREFLRWDERLDEIVRTCEALENNAYSPPGHSYFGRAYFACIETKRAKYFGAHDVMCEYHPIYALRDAVRQARRANDPFVQQVFIVSKWGGAGYHPPHVMYKDRQHLAELVVQAELLSEKERDPAVFLATYDGDFYQRKKRIALRALWTTSAKEWIPFVFTPKNFGPEFVEHLTAYYKSKGRR